MVCIINTQLTLTIHTTINADYLKLFYLLNFQSWSTLTMYKRARSLYPPQYQFCVLLCNAIKSSKEALADTTWVESTIATRYNYFEVDNMMYMGTVNNAILW